MKRWTFLLLLIPSLGNAVVNLTGFYASDGEKVPAECLFPHCVASSTVTINRLWDGHTIMPFSGKNMTADFDFTAYNNNAVDAGSVTLQMSSWTCTGNVGIVSTAVSSTSVMDTTTRPTQVFVSTGVKNEFVTILPYGRDAYEERQYPPDVRVPCTIIAGHCLPDDPTNLWTNRNYHDKHLPTVWVPNEEIGPSSYTVKAHQSQMFHVDVYVSTSIPAGTCNAALTVFEGATVSTAIPVAMTVYAVTLPQSPTLRTIVDIGNNDTDEFLNGTRFISGGATGKFLTGRNNLAKLIKAHGMIEVGDTIETSTQTHPSTEYLSHLDGTLYTAANGYGNARGVATPDPVYLIGMYSGPNWSTNTVTAFCTGANGWLQSLASYNVPGILYTAHDEDSGFSAMEQARTLSTWLSTVTTCAYNGNLMGFMQTDDLPFLVSTAPYVSAPTSANIFSNFAPSSTTWQVEASSIIAGNGQLGANGSLWRYGPNNALGEGGMFPYEEEGYVPEANYWALWKKLCPAGNCSRSGNFFYEGNLWRNGENNQANDVYNVSLTFGEYGTTDTVWGRSGALQSQGDGVFMYPGQNTVFPHPSFGVNGAFAGYIMKKVRDGVQDADILTLAYNVNPSSTTALVQTMFSKALWEVTCEDPVTPDCSYSYGDRTWLYTGDAWVRARESILQIAAGAAVTNTPFSQILKGQVIRRGKWRNL